MDRRAWVVLTIIAFILGTKAYAQSPPQQPSQLIQVFISDMHCKHCAKKIASKLYTVKGVRSVTTNVDQGLAVIVPSGGQVIAPENIWKAVETIKFTPQKIVTPQGVFVKKPPA